MPAGDARFTLRPRQRLTHARQFDAVHRKGVRRSAGAVLVSVYPNDKPFWRLGLSIGKRAGSAVERNRFKRLVRDAFRHIQHDLPLRPGDEGELGFDLVVGIRAHEELGGLEYRRVLLDLCTSAAREWQRRSAKDRDAS